MKQRATYSKKLVRVRTSGGSAERIVDINRQLLAATGGLFGVRDRDRIEYLASIVQDDDKSHPLWDREDYLHWADFRWGVPSQHPMPRTWTTRDGPVSRRTVFSSDSGPGGNRCGRL